mmetsp:Transcript_13250/g.37294  ORF Transcript_13250/g.37294 Transcript_13250/m.37294 type:complete len:437 (+) Transcript_13250:523-1833(+)
MIRQSCNAITKRSLHSGRCMFQQQQQQHHHHHHHHQLRRPLISTSTSTFSIANHLGSLSSSSSSSSSLSFRLLSSARTATARGSIRGSSGRTKTKNKTTRASSSATATTAVSPLASVLSRITSTTRLAIPLFSKETFRNALPIIGNGAYMALASGFLMTDMLHLRLMLVGGYAGLVSFHALHAKPLQIPLRWSALFVVVNAGAAILLFVDQWIGALLSDEERALYEEHFRDGLTSGQFYYLLKMASTREVDDGVVLTKEGQVSPYLYFIEKGRAKVYHHGTFAAYVDEGGFVNDVAFQQPRCPTGSESAGGSASGNDNGNDNVIASSSSSSCCSEDPTSSDGAPCHDGGAYGTVITNGECKVLVWEQEELRDYLEQRPEMDRNMKYTLSQHLVRSLLKQREVRRQLSVVEQDDLEQFALAMPQRKEFRRMRTNRWS